MLTKAEWLTAAVSAAGVVSMTVMATIFWSNGGTAPTMTVAGESPQTGRQLFEMSDAYFTCRDQISRVVPYRVRNINIDSHSSRYQESENSNFVVIELEVADESGGAFAKTSYDARVLCQVSAANNEIRRFRLTRG